MSRDDNAGALVIPAPADGRTYTREELAGFMGVTEPTVRHWMYVGRKVAGERVRLERLRAPRGRVTPVALVKFLEAVNGVEVCIG